MREPLWKPYSRNRAFDAAAIKRKFPGLADPRLHYLDSAATAQMPELVLEALRRFEVEARANVHEGTMRVHTPLPMPITRHEQISRCSWAPIRIRRSCSRMEQRRRSICWRIPSASF